MRDTCKILRTAIYTALSGISVPVYEEKRPSNSTEDIYVLLSTQQEVDNSTHDTFITDSSIDIEVCQRTGSEVSKDDIDDVSNEILTVLFPTATTDGITQPSLMQIQNLTRVRSITMALEISATESILRKIITISGQIVQQF